MTQTRNASTKAGNLLLRSPRGRVYACLLRMIETDPTVTPSLWPFGRRELLVNNGLIAEYTDMVDGDLVTVYRVTDHGHACLAEWQTRTYPTVDDVVDTAREVYLRVLTTPAGEHIENVIADARAEQEAPTRYVITDAPTEQEAPDTGLRYRVQQCLIGMDTYGVFDTESGDYLDRTDASGRLYYRMSHAEATWFAAVVNGEAAPAGTLTFGEGVRAIVRTGVRLPAAIRAIRIIADPDGTLRLRDRITRSQVEIARSQVQAATVHPAPAGYGRRLPGNWPATRLGFCGHPVSTIDWDLDFRVCQSCENGGFNGK
jgi:hypothetical protein